MTVQTPPLALSILDPHGPMPTYPLPGLPPTGGARASSRVPSDYRRGGGINYGHSKPQITVRTLPLPRLPLNVPGGWAKSGAALLPSPEVLFQTRSLPHLPPALPTLPAPTACSASCLGWEGEGTAAGGRAPWRHSAPQADPHPHSGEAAVPTGVCSRAKGHTAGCEEAGSTGSSPHPAVGTEQVTQAHSPTLKNRVRAPPRQGMQARPPPRAGPQEAVKPGSPRPGPTLPRQGPRLPASVSPSPWRGGPVATRHFPAPPRGRARDPVGAAQQAAVGMRRGEATGCWQRRGRAANTCRLRAQNPPWARAGTGDRPGALRPGPRRGGNRARAAPLAAEPPGHRHGSPRLGLRRPRVPPGSRRLLHLRRRRTHREAEERAFQTAQRSHRPARQSYVPGARGQGGGCAPGPRERKTREQKLGGTAGRRAPGCRCSSAALAAPRPRSGKRAPRCPHSPALIPAAAPSRPCWCGCSPALQPAGAAPGGATTHRPPVSGCAHSGARSLAADPGRAGPAPSAPPLRPRPRVVPPRPAPLPSRRGRGAPWEV